MSAPVEEVLPKDFGKYRLERKIATGGMAEIFLAHPKDAPGEPLVIKRILPHLIESSEFVSMFLDEARIAARLKHPHVVEIFDIGQIDGAYFIAMEYVHGEDIRRIYNRAYKLQRSLPLSHSIRVVAESAQGLGHAHKLTDDLTKQALCVVHRDVSPQNIIVTYEGSAKVVDFGIARAINKVNQTRAGVLKGKYSYMSPEQALGDEIDHRTDIFALGIILYETTTGTRLFKRHNELATLQAVIKCEIIPPSEALRGYPAALERVVLKALSKRREDRHQDGEALGADLFEFLESSGLYVDREVVAGFMHDLFGERLEEEKTSGVPALPKEEEIRAEMEPTGTVSVGGLSRPGEETPATGGDSASDEDSDAEAEPFQSAFADTVHRDRSGEMDAPDFTSDSSLPAVSRSDTILGEEPDEISSVRPPGFADDMDSAAGATRTALDQQEQIDRRAPTVTRADDPPAEMNAEMQVAETLAPKNPPPDADAGPDTSDDSEEEPPQTMLDESPPEMSIPPKERSEPSGRVEKVTLPSDMLPTVAAQPVYSDTGTPLFPDGSDARIEPEAPERRPELVEDTENIRRSGESSTPDDDQTVPRVRAVKKPSEKPRRSGDKAGSGARASGRPRPAKARPASVSPVVRWGIILGVLGMMITVFVIVRAPSRAKDAPPKTAPPSDRPVVESTHGEVRVVTEAGAAVYLDDTLLGKARADGRAGPFALPVGTRSLRVAHEERGFSRVREIEVSADRVHDVEIRARQGYLKIAVAPWGHVVLDGVKKGITPLADIILDEGTHRLVVENPDVGKRYEAEVEIEPGKIRSVKVDLNEAGQPL